MSEMSPTRVIEQLSSDPDDADGAPNSKSRNILKFFISSQLRHNHLEPDLAWVRLPYVLLVLGITSTLCVILTIAKTFALVYRHLSGEVCEGNKVGSQDWTWAFRLGTSILACASVAVPLFAGVAIVGRHRPYFLNRPGILVRALFLRDEEVHGHLFTDHTGASKFQDGSNTYVQADSTLNKFLRVISCSIGLQVVYLAWGVLQEKIMTQGYTNSDGDVGQFHNTEYLIFINRCMTLMVALIFLRIFHHQSIQRPSVPLSQYTYCAFFNLLSFWCQYESLKFVSFPMQVLAKSSKMLFLMVIGKLFMKKKYRLFEYFVAVVISFGMVLFLLGNRQDQNAGISSVSITTSPVLLTISVPGLSLIVLFLVADAFSASWFNQLFEVYKVDPIQALCGVSFLSALFVLASILQHQSQGCSGSISIMEFLVFNYNFPAFTFDIILNSFCSTVGQFLVIYTVKLFGPLVLVQIMVLCQPTAILLSCLLYNHSMGPCAILGIMILLLGSIVRVIFSQREHTENYHGFKVSSCPS